MNVFTQSEPRTALLGDPATMEYRGLDLSRSKELAQGVKDLFGHLNALLGFAPTPEGEEQQKCLILLLRNTYPELMIDLADRIYVQHERPMVVLNMDHLHASLMQDPLAEEFRDHLDILFMRWTYLFDALTDFIKSTPALVADPTIVRLLAESYSHYLHQTKNFPWEEPLDEKNLAKTQAPILDVASGLTGFSMIHDWPEENFPKLVLADSMPFIIQGLTHYKNLLGKKNVEILDIHFPGQGEDGASGPFGSIWAHKFLHHLTKEDRLEFLKWARERLTDDGTLHIVDTDLEYEILARAEDAEFADKLMPGYLETLVDIGPHYCKNLMHELACAGYNLSGFDVHEYQDETDAYSRHPGDNLSLRFVGVEIEAQRAATIEPEDPSQLDPQANAPRE